MVDHASPAVEHGIAPTPEQLGVIRWEHALATNAELREFFDNYGDGLNYLPDLYAEIVPGLWQGGTSRDQVIDREQPLIRPSGLEQEFDCVATLFAWAAPVHAGVEERRFGFPDGELMAEHFPQLESLAAWTHARWVEGRRVLVRCAGGINRSGLITAMTLMNAGHSAEAAIRLVRAGRCEWALSNPSFVAYLYAR